MNPVTAVGTFDDLHTQGRLLSDGVFDLAGVVAAIGPDEFKPIEALADAIEDQGGAIPILDGGGVNHHAQGQAFVSTRAWTLRPFTLLPASYPTASASPFAHPTFRPT